MSAEAFLNHLLEQGLLEPKVIDSLRQQVAKSKKKFSAKDVAKLLVSKGRLTKFQAQKALESGGAAEDEVADETGADEEYEYEYVDEEVEGDDEEYEYEYVDEEVEEEEDLQPIDAEPVEAGGLEPLDDSANEAGGLEPIDDTGGLQPLDEAGGLQPLDDGGGLQPLDDSGGLQPLDDGGLQPLDDGGGLQPLDDSGLQPLGEEAAAEPAEAEEDPKRPKKGKHVKQEAARRPWESPLILIGSGSLVALLFLSAVLYFVLTRGNAADMFQSAEEAYASGSYSTAKNLYSDYVTQFPRDENSSLARVKMGLAELRISSSGSNKEKALETAKEVMPRIKPEEKFTEGRTEVAGILPDIAEGLVKQARATEETGVSRNLTQKAEEAMKLVDEYVTGTVRKTQTARISKIQELIALEHREIARNERLDSDLKLIDAALASEDTTRAYDIRRQLLLDYPDLESKQKLIDAVSQITSLQKDLVVDKVQPIKALTDDPSAAANARVVLATTLGETAQSASGNQMVFLVRGSVYSLDAATGKVLWRRSVGFTTNSQPVRVGSDVLLVNGSRNELILVRAATGELVWRTPLEERFGDPLVLGERAYVASESGRVTAVNLNDGSASNYAQIPQPLSCPPGGDEKASKVYAVGEHSNLYVLSSTKLSCSEVFYLGHKAGTVATAPVMLRSHLFIAENAGSNYSLMHVLKTNNTGTELESVQQPFRLTGKVIVPPVILGRRLLVITDLGAITLLEMNLERRSEPVRVVAQFSQTSTKPLLGYSAADTSYLWVGDERLSRYAISTAKGTLDSDWRKPIGDAYLAPLQIFGDALCMVRKENQSASILATAVESETGSEIWRTELASPFAGPPVKVGDRLVGVSSQGNLYSVPSDVQGQTQLSPAATVRNVVNELSFSHQASLGDGKISVTSDVSPTLGLYADATSDPNKVTRVQLKIPDAPAATEPQAFAGGLLYASPKGQVLLLDPVTGEQKAPPFQPPLGGGQQVDWNRPAIDEVNSVFYITDKRQILYRVGSNMRSAADVDLPAPPISPIALTSSAVHVVLRTDEGDQLQSLAVAGLKPTTATSLESQLAWGPVVADDHVFAATLETIFCFDSDGKLAWKQPAAHGTPVGSPLADGGAFVFASSRGVVWKADPASGEFSANVDLNEPFMSGPVRLGQRLAIAGSDGVIHFLTLTP